MNPPLTAAACASPAPGQQTSPERHAVPDLADAQAYAAWRERKLAGRARSAAELQVDIGDPCALTPDERQALLQRCARWNMAIYRCRDAVADKPAVLALARQLGLRRLDGNWLADDDGLSSIAVRDGEPRGEYIPYTTRPIKWHTDGYYHPDGRRIHGMLLHCVRAAAAGGVNALLDHELAYIALRDASPRWLGALMASDAMTIPERSDEGGVIAHGQRYGVAHQARAGFPADELPGFIYRAVFVVGREDFVARLERQRARDHVHAGGGVDDENEVVGRGVNVSG